MLDKVRRFQGSRRSSSARHLSAGPRQVPGKKGKDDLCQLTGADFDERDLEALVVAHSRPGATPAGRNGPSARRTGVCKLLILV